MMGKNINNSTVPDLDVNRYMGKWYEIARFNHRFERGMNRVTAEYMIRPDGKIEVINCGYRYGKEQCIHGRAKIPDPAEPGRLRVAFFLFFYSDYRIMELDRKNYSYALVGGSTDKYLWILSRTPQLDSNTLTFLLTKARERGYDTQKLIFVEQE